MIDSQFLSSIQTTADIDLGGLSHKGPVLLVFLRHFGCVFCKEALKDIAKKRSTWEQKGVNIVLVHMSDEDTATDFFNRFGLHGITSVSDPDCLLYARFGLTKGSMGQLFGLKNWIRGFEVSGTGKALPSIKQIGDGFQMPGIFLLVDGEVEQSFIHKSAADRPDYDHLISCCAA